MKYRDCNFPHRILNTDTTQAKNNVEVCKNF